MRLFFVVLCSICLCSSPSLAATALKVGPIGYTVEGKAFEGYGVNLEPKHPLVILVHDWDGLTDYEIKRATMLAESGYAVFAVDLFGAGVRPQSIEEKKQQTATLYQDREKMRRLLYAAAQAAKDHGGNVENAVVMGYCFGGAAVLEFARSGAPYKGFVSFHGGLEIPGGQDYTKTQGQILILHGSADASVSMEDFAHLAQALERDHVVHEMITYSAAPHAFTVFDSERYQARADRRSWRRFLSFLEETLSGKQE